VSTTPYQTQPGTIPHRAIAHLQTLGDGAKLSTAELAEAIGAQTNGFPTCMRPARDAGMVVCSLKPGNRNILYWSLGTGVPLPKPDDYELDQPLEPAPRKPLTPLPVLLPVPVEVPDTPRHFRAGLFTDGAMLLEVGADKVELDAGETSKVKTLLWGVT